MHQHLHFGLKSVLCFQLLLSCNSLPGVHTPRGFHIRVLLPAAGRNVDGDPDQVAIGCY